MYAKRCRVEWILLKKSSLHFLLPINKLVRKKVCNFDTFNFVKNTNKLTNG